MTDNEIRIAIVEECGWKRVSVYEWTGAKGAEVRTPKQWVDYDVLPDYLNDLNACHDMENADCLDGLRYDYVKCLGKVVIGVEEPIQWVTVHATARQRCEAFLRTLGKWKGE